MSSVIILFGLSMMIGFALGRFRWPAIAVSGVALAASSAAALRLQGFDALPGIAIIVICLAVNQAAYLTGALFAGRA